MNELELIQRLTRALPTNDSLLVGAGDDCAVLDLKIPGQSLLFKTDAVVEGVHFTRDDPPQKIGHKALARCLSDMAAMAGTPTAALITLALPGDFELGFIEAIYEGIKSLAQRFEVAIAGGETTTNPDRILISVAMIGIVATSKCVLRSGAQAGDAIFVSGELGGSLKGKHLEIEPRLREARWLADHFNVHSMIDLSDGLATDLRHLLRASQVGAEVLSEAIPISRAARLQAKTESSTKPPLLAALTDGEDFELLFTLASKDAVPLVDGWKEQFPGLRLSCIGKITAEAGLRMRNRAGLQPLAAHGYTHFQKS